MYSIVLIGSGVWGQKYILTFLNSFPNICLKIANRDNWQRLVDNKPNGVIICTPPDSHVEIASYALERGISTLIEKPITLSSKDAEKLSKFTAPILVNHIHLFAPAYEELKKRLSSSIISIRSVNKNNGPFRNYSSLLDYGCHDVAMSLDLFNHFPVNVTTLKHDSSNGGKLWDLSLSFNNQSSSHITVGNGAQNRSSFLEVHCEKEKFLYDKYGLTQDSNVFQSTVTPLERAIDVFIKSIDGITDSRLGIKLSIDVMKTLELCS